MKRSLLVFAVSLFGAVAVAPSLVEGAYVVYTRDGNHFVVESKPRIEGLQAYVRLLPSRQLAVIHEELIDWPRTESANAPGQFAVPESATLVRGQEPTRQEPIVHKIIGTPGPPVSPVSPNPTEPPQEEADSKAPPSNDAPASAEAARMGEVAGTVEQAIEQRKHALRQRLALQEELERMESSDATAAGNHDDRLAYINRLRETLEAVDRRIAELDKRISQGDQPR